jgi:hypothetical protein
MQDFEKIKDYFRDADEDTLNTIVTLEKSIKRNQLFLNLRNHDGMKMIIEFCEKMIGKIDTLLLGQKASDLLANKKLLIDRAYYEAYRDSMRWLISIFSVAEKRVESSTKRVEKISENIPE